MNNKLSMVLGGLLLISQAAMAQTTFNLSASVPQSTGVTMTVSKVTVNSSGAVTSFVAQPPGTTALAFGTLTFNSSTNVWQAGPVGASFYWAIDITPTAGGTGTAIPSAVTYTDGSLPSGQTVGLGGKTALTFSKVVYATSSSSTETPLSTYRLGAIGALPTTTQINGGWTRMDIGLCTGNTNSANGAVDPAGCGPFTNADRPGTYVGSLIVTGSVT